MGHYCRICKRIYPNESFSGGGHRNHICKKCKKIPIEERQVIEQEDEIFGFLNQSHISDKNIKRLEVLKSSANAKISEYASIVFEVAKVQSFKRGRLKILAEKRMDLLIKLNETGLIFAHHY